MRDPVLTSDRKAVAVETFLKRRNASGALRIKRRGGPPHSCGYMNVGRAETRRTECRQ